MALFLMLMGPQGAGKGVQAQRLSGGLGIPHVSTGDLFRAMRQRDDALAREVQAIMAAGHLIDDELTNQVLRDRLEQPDAKTGAVLDGYPRNLVQAKFLDEYLARRDDKLDAILLLELDLFEAFRRSYGRVTATDGRSYNIYSNDIGVEWGFEEDSEGIYPPRLWARLRKTNEDLIRRPDDGHAHAIIQRIAAFQAEKEALVGYYEARGLLKRIDASQDIESVTRAITAAALAVEPAEMAPVAT